MDNLNFSIEAVSSLLKERNINQPQRFQKLLNAISQHKIDREAALLIQKLVALYIADGIERTNEIAVNDWHDIVDTNSFNKIQESLTTTTQNFFFCPLHLVCLLPRMLVFISRCKNLPVSCHAPHIVPLYLPQVKSKVDKSFSFRN